MTSRDGISYEWLSETPTAGGKYGLKGTGRGILRSASDATDMVSPSVARGDFSKIRHFRNEVDHRSSSVRFIAPLDDEDDDLEAIALTPRQVQDQMVKSKKLVFRRIGSGSGSKSEVRKGQGLIKTPPKARVAAGQVKEEPARLMRDPSFDLDIDEPKSDSFHFLRKRSETGKPSSWFKSWTGSK